MMNYSSSYTRPAYRLSTDQKRLPLPLTLLLLAHALEPSNLLSVKVSNFSVTIFEILLLFCLVTTVFESRGINYLARKASPVRARPYVRSVLLLIALTLLVFIVGLLFVPIDNLYYDLRLILNLAEHAVLVALLAHHLKTPEQIRAALLLVLWSALAAAAMTIVQAQGWLDFGFETTFRQGGSGWRVAGLVFGTRGLDNAVMIYGALFLMALPIVLMTGKGGTRTVVQGAQAVLLALAILVIASRSVWLSAVLQALLGLILWASFATRKPRPILIVLVALGVVGALAYWGPGLFAQLVAIRSYSVDARTDVYLYGLNALLQSVPTILFGAGKGGIFAGTASVVHNLFLDVLFSKGAIAFLLVLIMFTKIAINLAQSYRSALTLSKGHKDLALTGAVLLLILFGMLVHGMGAPTFGAKPLWSSIGIIVAYITATRQQAITGQNSVNSSGALRGK